MVLHLLQIQNQDNICYDFIGYISMIVLSIHVKYIINAGTLVLVLGNRAGYHVLEFLGKILYYEEENPVDVLNIVFTNSALPVYFQESLCLY